MKKQSKLYSSLKELGISQDIDTFPERKKLQKLVYLLGVFGINLDFNFEWYLHGPYSRSLTKTLYENRNMKINLKPLTKTELSKIEELKEFLDKDIDSNDFLELLVSLHYLRQEGKKVYASKEEVIEVFRTKKPWYSNQDIKHAWKKLDLISRYH